MGHLGGDAYAEFIGSYYSRGEGEAAKKVRFEMGLPKVEGWEAEP